MSRGWAGIRFSGRLLLAGLVSAFGWLPDGRAGQWTVRGPDIGGVDFLGVTHTANGFYAVGVGGTIASSPTGDEWTFTHLEPRDLLIGIGSGNGRIIAVGRGAKGNAGVLWTSLDGLHWERTLDNAPAALTRIAFGPGKIVAVGPSGYGGDTVISVSSNGTSWTHQRFPYPQYSAKDVIFVQDRFLYSAGSGVYSSVDGIAWTETNARKVLGHTAIGLAVKGSTAVVVARFGSIAYSEDKGKTWTNAVTSETLSYLDVAAGPELFVAVGDNGRIMTSNDGRTWTKRVSGSSALLYDAAYGDGVWVVVGGGGTILKSTDGVAWATVSSPTPRFKAIAFGSGRFVAASREGIMVSNDGLDWEFLPGQKTADSVAFGNGIFVAVSKDIEISPDGLNWTFAAKNPTPWWGRVVYGNGRFMATGGVDALNFPSSWALTSSDGATWTPVVLPAQLIGQLDQLTFVDGKFIAASSFYQRGIVLGETNGMGPEWLGFCAFGPAGALRLESGGYGGYVSVGGRRSQSPLVSYLTGGDYAGGKYFVFGGGYDGVGVLPAAVWVSDNGETWRDISPPTDRVLRSAAAGNGRLVVVGDGIIIERPLDDAFLETPALKATVVGSDLELSWPSRRGHVYRFESSTDRAGWMADLSSPGGLPLSWTGTGGRLTRMFRLNGGARLFRLVVSAE